MMGDAYLAIHRNYEPMYVESVVISHLAAVVSATFELAFLTDEHVGYYLLIQQASSYIWARIKSVTSPTECVLGDPEIEDLAAMTDIVGAADGTYRHCLIAYKMFRKPLTKKGVQELVNQQGFLPGNHAIALSIAFQSDCSGDAMPLNARLGGAVDSAFQTAILP